MSSDAIEDGFDDADRSDRPLNSDEPRETRLVPPTIVDTGEVRDGRVSFPPWRGDADTPSGGPPAPLPPDRRVGFAVVGLGRLSLEEILPAFRTCERARLVALVSGSPEKMAVVAGQYDIPPERCFDYEAFDAIRDDPSIQAVYLVLPNAMHRSFTERAAAAGKHVLTEKPMSVSAADAQAMVDACRGADVRLMVAYRIHFETYNRRARDMIAAGDIGRVVAFTGINTQTVAPDGAEQWRHKRAMAGGGSLVDIGLYCLNTARFMIGEEPCEVFATAWSPPGDARFAEVEETISFMLRFPSGAVANCLTSYGGRDDKTQRINGERAVLEMPNAYPYRGQRLVVVGRQDDATSLSEIVLQPANQFAAELDHMARCIVEGTAPATPGEEGVRDHVLMEAIYESARTGRPVAVGSATPDRSPTAAAAAQPS